MKSIKDLKGLIVTEINNEKDELIFTIDNGDKCKLHHWQDCCESVTIEDIEGDLNDLIGSPILVAEEINSEQPEDWSPGEYTESYTWTFYKFATIKGYVTVRWFGESNGYYSESVDFSFAESGENFKSYWDY